MKKRKNIKRFAFLKPCFFTFGCFFFPPDFLTLMQECSVVLWDKTVIQFGSNIQSSVKEKKFDLPIFELFDGRGPQILTVPSSDALASMPGTLGFQWTQFTVRLWPSNTVIGISRRTCQIYTLLSGISYVGSINLYLMSF